MSRSSLLLLDEPCVGLEPILVGRFFETIKEIAATCLTALMVEQNIRSSLELTDQRRALENGRVIMEGSGSELMDNAHMKR
jgi:branched-chain amino acid transport system ATP-binding protein